MALDAEEVQLLEYIIAKHRKRGGIVIVSTHLAINRGCNVLGCQIGSRGGKAMLRC